jgi:hypothetical protein
MLGLWLVFMLMLFVIEPLVHAIGLSMGTKELEPWLLNEH